MWLLLLASLLAGIWLLAGSGRSEPHGAVVAAREQLTAATTAEPVPPAKPDMTPVAVASAACVGAEQFKTQLKALRNARREDSKALVQLLQHAGVSTDLQLAYLQSLGANVLVLNNNDVEARQALQRDLQSDGWQPVPGDAELYLHRGISRHDYQELLQWLAQHPQDSKTLKVGFATFLQLILYADPQLSAHQLQALLDAGLPVTLTELKVAAAAGVDVTLLAILQRAGPIDIQQHWYDLQQRKLNLTLQAAQLGSPLLFDYWLAQGVPASVGPAQNNAFDLLPRHTEPQAVQNLLPLIRTLLRLQLAPVSTETQWFWLQQLPAPEAQQLQQLLAPQDPVLLPVADPAVTQLANALQKQAKDRDVLLAQIRQCLGPAGLAAVLMPSQNTDMAIRLVGTELKVLQSFGKQQQDPQQRQQLALLAAVLPALEKLIAARDHAGLDQLEVKLQQDPAWQQASLHADDIAVLVLQFMLLEKSPPDDIVSRIQRKFGQVLPERLMYLLQFHLKYNAGNGLAAALQDAGYDIPSLPARK